MTAALSPATTSMRPWYTSGVALLGAGAIALAPISPVSPLTPVRDPTPAVSAQAQLAALEWPYILSLPIVRQWATNRVEIWAVWLGGFARAGAGLVESLLTIPGVTIEAIQQLLALDFVGAFETVTGAIRDGVVAVVDPLVQSWVWRNGAVGAVQEALAVALPQAIAAGINGFLTAANVVTVSFIEGAQGLAQAVLTFNLGNIVDASIEGTRNFIISLGTGAQAIVGGIVTAQELISGALAARPTTANSVADISALRAPVGEVAVGGANPFKAVTLDTTPARKQPLLSGAAAEVADPLIKAEPQDAPELPAASDISPPADVTEVSAPEKPARVNPVIDLQTRIEKSVENLNDRVQAEQQEAEKAIKKVADRFKSRAHDAGLRSVSKPAKADAE